MSGWKHAFSLSKEQVRDATPPGTVTLIEHRTSSTNGQASADDAGIIKYPLPSSDPADPLNWPTWRKMALLATVSLYAFVANFTSADIAAALQLWPKFFPTDPQSESNLVHLIAVNVLFLGVANIWWVPLSNWMGRRPVLLIATLLLTLCTVWAGLATSYHSLLAARIFQGIGGAPADTVAPALVGDVFFMHERGRAMAIYTLWLCLGPIVGGIVGGYIAFNMGWTYIFWIGTALSGACFLSVALLVPETLYSGERPILEHTHGSAESEKGDLTVHVEQSSCTNYAPFTFFRSLGFKRPRGSLLRASMAPWLTLVFPGTWVVMFHYAGLVGGIVTISTLGAQLVAAPPYLWGANAGLINIGGLIGAILGVIYTYVVADLRLTSRAKRERHGYAEPEDRLPTMFPALAIATCGFFVFGFCAQYPGEKVWVALEVGYGMITFGLLQIPSIGFNYIIDSYSYRAADCFLCVTILRAIISFSWTFFVLQWSEKDGPAEAFGIFGMLMGIFSLLTVPLWLWGKRSRIATAKRLDNSARLTPQTN
ncbi:major facilitator superfamily transporter [Mariannaea sp. PMI_226]|nr:major facilitator superfamily transporter [Mariannaea sp. PMI_226]